MWKKVAIVRSRKTYVYLPLYVKKLGMAGANEKYRKLFNIWNFNMRKKWGGVGKPQYIRLRCRFEYMHTKKYGQNRFHDCMSFCFDAFYKNSFSKCTFLFFFYILLYIWKILKNKEPLCIDENCRASEIVTDLWQVLNHLTAQRSSLVIACRIPKSLLKTTPKTCIIRRGGGGGAKNQLLKGNSFRRFW